MKATVFEKLIRKVVREEIDYALRREIKTLKEDLCEELKPTIVEQSPQRTPIPKNVQTSLKEKIMGKKPISKKADINKNKKIEPWEAARSRAIAKSMAKKKPKMKKGGSATKGTHVTKEGKTAKKGLWYNIHQKRKRGAKMRKPGAKGAPTAAALKRSQS